MLIKLTKVTEKLINWFFEKADFKLVYVTYKHLLAMSDDKLKNYSGSPKDRQKFKDLIGIKPIPAPASTGALFESKALPEGFTDD